MNVTITGASGGIGAHLVRGLRRAGLDVRGLVRDPSACGAPGWVCGDVRNPIAVRTALRGAHVAIHAAGLAHRRCCDGSRLAQSFYDVNIGGTRTVCEAAVREGTETVILLSSASVYGESLRAGPAAEWTPCHPDGAYGASKLGAEQAAQDALAGSSVRLVILRLATVYGPGIRGNIRRFVQLARTGVIVGVAPGTARKSLLFIDDLVSLCVFLAARPAGHAVLNVASPGVHSVRDIARTIRRQLAGPVHEVWLNPAIVRAAVGVNAFVVRRLGGPCLLDRQSLRGLTGDAVIDARKMRDLVGEEMASTGLDRGIRAMLAAGVGQ